MNFCGKSSGSPFLKFSVRNLFIVSKKILIVHFKERNDEKAKKKIKMKKISSNSEETLLKVNRGLLERSI